MEQSNVELWAVIVGFALPPLIAALNRRAWSSAAKALVAFAVCWVVALVGSYLDGSLDNRADPVRAFLVVFVAAITTFHLWWKPSGILDRLEKATG